MQSLANFIANFIATATTTTTTDVYFLKDYKAECRQTSTSDPHVQEHQTAVTLTLAAAVDVQLMPLISQSLRGCAEIMFSSSNISSSQTTETATKNVHDIRVIDDKSIKKY